MICNVSSFLSSRAAVLRGRVVTTSGRGLTGVRVTHADIHTEGYTMTQEDGWFDFMVNGGGGKCKKISSRHIFHFGQNWSTCRRK